LVGTSSSSGLFRVLSGKTTPGFNPSRDGEVRRDQ
jgi:ribosomal protein S6E (S10)